MSKKYDFLRIHLFEKNVNDNVFFNQYNNLVMVAPRSLRFWQVTEIGPLEDNASKKNNFAQQKQFGTDTNFERHTFVLLCL